MTVIDLRLPYPPSVNHYWGEKVVLSKKRNRNGKRRYIIIKYLTRRAKDFRATVDEIVHEQYNGRPPMLRDRLLVELRLRFGPQTDNHQISIRAQDIDNGLKGLFDALEHAKVYIDDEQIDALSVVKERRAAVGYVLVRIKTIGD